MKKIGVVFLCVRPSSHTNTLIEQTSVDVVYKIKT